MSANRFNLGPSRVSKHAYSFSLITLVSKYIPDISFQNTFKRFFGNWNALLLFQARDVLFEHNFVYCVERK